MSSVKSGGLRIGFKGDLTVAQTIALLRAELEYLESGLGVDIVYGVNLYLNARKNSKRQVFVKPNGEECAGFIHQNVGLGGSDIITPGLQRLGVRMEDSDAHEANLLRHAQEVECEQAREAAERRAREIARREEKQTEANRLMAVKKHAMERLGLDDQSQLGSRVTSIGPIKTWEGVVRYTGDSVAPRSLPCYRVTYKETEERPHKFIELFDKDLILFWSGPCP